ncbi:UNVERIFIED_CONTAM: FAD-dependent oxidoreductase [Mycobacterium avium subsp. hominissuis]
MNSQVIVGGGLAGATAAFTLRARGFPGRITLVCEEEHVPYSKPELPKRVLRGDFLCSIPWAVDLVATC